MTATRVAKFVVDSVPGGDLDAAIVRTSENKSPEKGQYGR
jgi:hypothetical protein